MSLAEIYRPTTRQDLVGNRRAIEKVEECIMAGKVCLLHGPSGVGKTTCVSVIAKEIGWKTHEWNASDSRKKADFEIILRELKNKPFVPTIYILDEIDGIEDFKGLEQCIKNTRNTLVLICNKIYEIPKTIRDLCSDTQIQFYEPQISEVQQAINRISKITGRNPDYSRISRDIRSSINNCFYSGDKYQSDNIFSSLEKLFKTGSINGLNLKEHSVWLLDNATEQLHGKNLFTFYKLLDTADRLDNMAPLQCVHGGSAKIEYPRYFRRRTVLKETKKSPFRRVKSKK